MFLLMNASSVSNDKYLYQIQPEIQLLGKGGILDRLGVTVTCLTKESGVKLASKYIPFSISSQQSLKECAHLAVLSYNGLSVRGMAPVNLSDPGTKENVSKRNDFVYNEAQFIKSKIADRFTEIIKI